MKKMLVILFVLALFAVGFGVPPDRDVRVRLGKVEACHIFLLDGGTEFIPGDPPTRVAELVLFGVSGNGYSLFPGDAQFGAALERCLGF